MGGNQSWPWRSAILLVCSTQFQKAIITAQYIWPDSDYYEDFLQPGGESTVMKRGVKGKHCRCATIYLESVDEETCKKKE